MNPKTVNLSQTSVGLIIVVFKRVLAFLYKEVVLGIEPRSTFIMHVMIFNGRVRIIITHHQVSNVNFRLETNFQILYLVSLLLFFFSVLVSLSLFFDNTFEIFH